MMTLATLSQAGHNSGVLFNSGTGFSSPNTKADDAAKAVFLRPQYATRAPSMAGRGGEPSGCRFLSAGLLTPPCARHPRLAAGSGSKPTKEAITMPKLSRALSRLFPAVRHPIAHFPLEAEAVNYARAYLAQTGRAVAVLPAAQGYAVMAGGAA
ncbi:hypothetical protein CXB49_01140 [Chromobacterium sp. ATCC 53434]|nr:hypothetical protein CXB49_01140 [Chromobacterium sp. ATCC 53434]